jgi:hypothetical protein
LTADGRRLTAFGWQAVKVLAAALFAVSAPLKPAGAQRLFGSVVLGDEKTPASGALIIAIDTAGVAQVRELANARGEFVIPVSHPGRYTVSALRVGSREETVPNVVVEAGKDLRLRIVMARDVPRPDPLATRSPEQCNIAADTTALGHAWSQFLIVLATADIAADAGAFVGTWSRRDVALRKNLRDTLSIRDTTERVGLDVQLFATIPPDSSAIAGFVTETDAGIRYNVPDIETLRSPEFMRRRCFAFVPPPSTQPDWFGVHFRSTAFRIGNSNIEGTIWMDRATLEPRGLGYRYINLPPAYVPAEPGGTLRFVQLTTGHWIVDEWTHRIPAGVFRRMFVYDRRGSPVAFSGQLTLDGVHAVTMRLTNLEVNGTSILRRPE